MTWSEAVAASIAELLEADPTATGFERAIIAADFIREALDVVMVKVVIDDGIEAVTSTAFGIDRVDHRSVWERLTNDDLMVVRATGGRREIELPNGYRAVCVREGDDRVSMTLVVVGGEGEAPALEVMTTLLRTALAAWKIGEELARLRSEVTSLATALTSRVLIEQAKGVLAERWSVDPAEAFTRLRKSARSSGSPLTTTAAEVVRSIGSRQEVH